MGSEYRRDDGAGPAAVALVAQQCPGVTVVGPLDDPLDLLGLWDGADLVVVVDAISSDSPPGMVQLVELDSAAPRPVGVRGASARTALMASGWPASTGSPEQSNAPRHGWWWSASKDVISGRVWA